MAPGNVVYDEVFEPVAFAESELSVFNEAVLGDLYSVRESHRVISAVNAIIYCIIEVGFEALSNELVDGLVASDVDYDVEGVLLNGLSVLVEFGVAEVVNNGSVGLGNVNRVLGEVAVEDVHHNANLGENLAFLDDLAFGLDVEVHAIDLVAGDFVNRGFGVL